jgi:hypothetical protein
VASQAYEYLSDDGNTYQVVLQSDFALALGYVVATGLEPYLPTYISMRYATYQSSNALYINPVYVTYPFSSGNPPASISVGTLYYFLKSSYGESRGGAAFNANLLVIAGPQGPPGTGSSGVSSVTGGTGVTASPTTGAVVLANTGVTSVAAGSGISVSGSTGNVTITNTGSTSSFAPTFSSGAQSISLSHLYNIAHGLGRNPYFMRAYLVCTTADNGYSIGDELEWENGQDISSTEYNGCAGCNSTDVFLAMGPGDLLYIHKSSFAPVALTNASWALHLDAW